MSKLVLQKIIILGLDNSGKTCILVSLKEDTNLLSYFSLKPTKGVHIERFDCDEVNMAIWDFGGQNKYREDYLREFSKYLDGVDKAIYVIDVQDRERYELALDYLKEIIEKIIAEKLKVDFSVFLHKYDPNLKKQEEFKDIDEIVKKELIEKIRALFPSDYNHKIFRTSIYTVFDKELIP